jgi:hypothetical protein
VVWSTCVLYNYEIKLFFLAYICAGTASSTSIVVTGSQPQAASVTSITSSTTVTATTSLVATNSSGNGESLLFEAF